MQWTEFERTEEKLSLSVTISKCGGLQINDSMSNQVQLEKLGEVKCKHHDFIFHFTNVLRSRKSRFITILLVTYLSGSQINFQLCIL